MRGIQFLTDEHCTKTAAIIDRRIHDDLWEDLQDVLVSRSRSREKGIPLARVEVALVASARLHH